MLTIPERYNVSLMLDSNLAAGRSSKVAIYCAEERLTYGDLFDRVCRMGRALLELGVRREERVLLVLGDTPAFPIAFLSAIRIGAVPVPVNPLFRAEDYRYFVEDTSARFIVSDEAFASKLVEALQGYQEPVTIISTGSEKSGTLRMADMLAAQHGELPPADTHRDDMAFWLYSSGSTGNPKGVVHLHHDIPYTCETYARHVLGITEEDITFSRVLFHAYGLGNSISFPFWVGASSVLYPDRPTPQGILETVLRFRPTLFFSVPTLYNAILNDPASVQYDLSSIRKCISAAEPLPPSTWQRWHETFGLSILDGIGSTEMLHIFCSNTSDEVRPGSSGKPVLGYDLLLLDEEECPVAQGGTGNLYVKGDSSAPCYWNQPEKSKKTMRGQWVFTGDRYRVDEEGFYWYEGRVDDMIKVGGEWVSPIEIENMLLEHPAVGEVAVVGVQVEGIMRIKAVVVLVKDLSPSAVLTCELQEWCKNRLQRYKYPHYIDFAEALPKTLTGKIQRFKLRETTLVG
jgi:benzoate-CoA ligase family protein